jgi:hypothetical protein
MNQHVWLFRALYQRLLGLYPAAFRAEFADEMLGVFTQSLADRAHQSGWRLTAVLLREYCAVLAGATREHLQYHRSPAPPADPTVRARWLARGVAVLALLWWGSITLLNEDVQQLQGLSIAIALVPALVGLFLTRHERIGGWLMITSGLLLMLLLAIGQSQPVILSLWAHVFLLCLVSLPFVIAGTLLIACAHAAASSQAAG